ncbi:MAG: hypothetical protein QXW35_02945 [Candidatus Aenigmatarchaeota archaeon]
MVAKKAISEVLAMLLMVVIVVGLIGVAYFFISGMVTRQTAGTIQVGSVNCIVGQRLEVLATNVGTTTIPAAEIRVFIGGGLITARTITAEDKNITNPLTNIDPGVSFWILINDVDPNTAGNQAPAAGRTYRGQIVYAGKATNFMITC